MTVRIRLTNLRPTVRLFYPLSIHQCSVKRVFKAAFIVICISPDCELVALLEDDSGMEVNSLIILVHRIGSG